MSTTTAKSTPSTFQRLQSRGLKNASTVSKRVGKGRWNSARNSFAYYVAAAPTFERGTIARDIIVFLNRKKSPIILQEVVREIMKCREKSGSPYKNYDSARRCVGRVSAQLSHWNFITSGKNDKGLITFEINRENPADLPKK